MDTHCHIDAYADPRGVLAAAESAKVDVVAISEDPEGYRRLRTRVGSNPRVTVALGLHPAGRAARDPAQLSRFFRMLPDATWIGEVGLDSRADTSKAEIKGQRALLESILGHGQIRSKYLSVHSRGTAKETIDLLLQARVTAILHWYTGPLALVETALAGGLWFSINQAMVDSTRGSSLVKALPQDRVLLETDGPYCKVRGVPLQPADLPQTVEGLARLWGGDEDSVRSRLLQNMQTYTESVGPNTPST